LIHDDLLDVVRIVQLTEGNCTSFEVVLAHLSMLRENKYTPRVNAFALWFCLVNVQSLDDKDYLSCYKQKHAPGPYPLPPKCFSTLPANGTHSVTLAPSCKIALDENSFVSAIQNAPKAPPPQFTDVLLITATYYFDKRMHADWSLWSRQFQALNAKIKKRRRNHRYHFAIAYTGMMDKKPTPLSAWHGRGLNAQKKCGTTDACAAPPPPGVDIRVITKAHIPGKYFQEQGFHQHGHYTLPVAMKNIFESENKTFSHVWFFDPDIAFLGNFAEFVHHNMVTRGETLLGTVAIARSLRQSYEIYSGPSNVAINPDWSCWKSCAWVESKDKRGLVPMVLRLSASVLNTLPLHYDKACYLEVFIPTVCNLYVPNCTIGTVAKEFQGFVTWNAPNFAPSDDKSSAKLLKALSMDWRFNQSTLWHPVKLHDDWRSLEPMAGFKTKDLSFLGADKTDVWSRHGVEFGSRSDRGTHNCTRYI